MTAQKISRSREEIKQALAGPVPSIRTPFCRDGSLDFQALANMVEFDLSAGAKALMLTWGDSLFSLLTEREVAELTTAVIAQTAGRALVIAADSGWATPATIEFARFAKEAGADLLMVKPADWGPSSTVETLTAHYAAVSQQIPVMVVTNTFIPRGVAFGVEVVKATLESAPGVVAIKDDFVGQFARKMSLLVHDQWAVVSGGLKQNHLDVYPYGCQGYLSTFITFKPEVTRQYWSAIESNDLGRAVEVIGRFDTPLFDYLLNLPGGHDAGMHAVLEICGLCGRWRRPPFYSLNDQEMERLSDFLKELLSG